MSEAAPAFIPRRSFVKRERLSLDSTGFLTSADVTAQPFSRADSAIQIPRFKRISEQKQSLGRIFESRRAFEIA
jgi:hypothetical protein